MVEYKHYVFLLCISRYTCGQRKVLKKIFLDQREKVVIVFESKDYPMYVIASPSVKLRHCL